MKWLHPPLVEMSQNQNNLDSAGVWPEWLACAKLLAGILKRPNRRPNTSTMWSIDNVSEQRYAVTIVWRYRSETKHNQTEKQARWWEQEFKHDDSIMSIHVKPEPEK